MASGSDEEDEFVMVSCPPNKVKTRVINGLVTADLTKYDFVKEFPDFTTYNNLQVIRMPTSALNDVSNENCKIPNSFCSMKYLTKLCLFGELHLTDAGLTCLPEHFGNLKSLEELNLQHNSFSKFPEQICALPKLKKLYLNSCGLISISTNISSLMNLEEADFGQNDFSNGLPKELFDLPKLKDLYLNECNLKHLPPEIGNLQQLQGIRLNNNNLEELPDELFTLRHLKKLSATNNRISRLSPDIIKLQNLEFLLLKENDLKVLPKEISKLLNLRLINVFDNKLTCLPDTITEMESSLQFIIQGNQYLQRPPLSICTKGINSIKGYFESMKKNEAVHSNRIKIVMFGEAGAGKTCLTQALVSCNATDPSEDDSTIGVEIHHWQIEPKGLEACIVDLAGQRRYQLTHPFFLSEESLHILVVNLKEYQCNKESFKNHVEHWIKWVTARLWKPRIMIVATHKDECENKDIIVKCKDILERIQNHEKKEIARLDAEIKKLKKKSFSHGDRSVNVDDELDKLRWMKKTRPSMSSKLLFADDLAKTKVEEEDSTCISIVPVCSKKELQGMIPLREEITRVVKAKYLFPSVGQDLSPSWVKLEEAIKKYRQEVEPPQVPCMTLSEFHKFALDEAELPAGIELESALEYLDTVGEIKFYKQMPGDEYSVFLDLQWLCKLVKLLFRHDFFQEESEKNVLEFEEVYEEFSLEKIGFDQLVDDLKDNGVLSVTLLRCIWYELKLDDEEFQKLIKALVCFGLACELPLISGLESSLLIPWFLHSEIKPEQKEALFPNMHISSETEYKLRYSMVGYLPYGLFDRLCVHSYGLGVDVFTWKNSMLICIEDIKIFLEVKDTYITLTGRTGSQSNEDLWNALLKIVEGLGLLLKEWPRLGWRTYTVCPHCVENKESKPRYFECNWLEGKAPHSLRCSALKRISKDLLVPTQDLLAKRRNPIKQITENVSDMLIVKLSNKLPNEWWKLAGYVGLSNDEISVIRENESKVEEKTNTMLQKWKAKNGSDATRSKLIDALRKVERMDLVEVAIKHYDD